MVDHNNMALPTDRATHEPNPQAVSSVPVGIPSAGMLPHTTYHSCYICFGTRVAFGEACRTCADPDPAVARYVIERLHPDQMAFLRAYGHTLAQQPLAEGDYPSIEFFVEADDGVFDEDAESYDETMWLVPPTRHWFAGGMSRFGPCGTKHFIHYNPLGLLLRECLMAGADAAVPQSRPAQAMAARSGETGTGSTVGNGAVPTGYATPTTPKDEAND